MAETCETWDTIVSKMVDDADDDDEHESSHLKLFHNSAASMLHIYTTLYCQMIVTLP